MKLTERIDVLDKGYVCLVDHMGTDQTVTNAARVSYNAPKQKTDDETLLKYLMRHGHLTPFEMCAVTFQIKLPIFVARQLIRHRTLKVNEISGRYSKLESEFYVPLDEHVTTQNTNNKQGGTNEPLKLSTCLNPDAFVDTDIQDAADCDDWFSFSAIFEQEQKAFTESYNKMIDSGMRKELARINMPLSQYTQMFVSCDLRNWFNFLKLRLDHHAQYEIRVYAEAVYTIISNLFPLASEAFQDYVLDSVILSGPEIKAFHLLIEDPKADLEKTLPNKRERDEFLSKFIMLGNIK